VKHGALIHIGAQVEEQPDDLDVSMIYCQCEQPAAGVNLAQQAGIGIYEQANALGVR